MLMFFNDWIFGEVKMKQEPNQPVLRNLNDLNDSFRQQVIQENLSKHGESKSEAMNSYRLSDVHLRLIMWIWSQHHLNSSVVGAGM